MYRYIFVAMAAAAWLSSPQAVAASKSRSAERTKARAAKVKRVPPGPIIEAPAESEGEAEVIPDLPVEEGGAATPAPSAAPAPPAADNPEVPAPNPHEAALDPEALRARYDELRDQVFRSRARRETMEKALFSTKVGFEVRWEANRRYRLDKAEMRLDGTRIWDTSERPMTEDPIQLAERAVAPGLHVLTIRLEVHSRDKVQMGYTSEQNFHINLPEGKASRVRVSVDEDGSLPSYNPEVEVKVDD